MPSPRQAEVDRDPKRFKEVPVDNEDRMDVEEEEHPAPTPETELTTIDQLDSFVGLSSVY